MSKHSAMQKTLELSKITAHDIAVAGGKGASLGELKRVGVPVPAIIPQALFDRVQERLAWNRAHYRNPRQVQLLSSLVRCGHCGSSFYAYQRHYTDSRRRNPKRVCHKVAYRCNWKVRQLMHSKKSDIRRCDNKEISARYLEDHVFALIAAVMFDREKIRRCMDFFKEKTKAAHLRLEKELKAIEDAMQSLAEKKKRIIDVYASGDLSRDSYVKKSIDYDNEILKLKKKRSDILKRIPLLHKTKVIDASIRQYCETAQMRYQQCVDFETKRQFLLDYVEKVTYWKDKLAVHGAVPVLLKQEYADTNEILDSETNKVEFCIESKNITKVSIAVT